MERVPSAGLMIDWLMDGWMEGWRCWLI